MGFEAREKAACNSSENLSVERKLEIPCLHAGRSL